MLCSSRPTYRSPMDSEEWRPIPGRDPRYEISSGGRIRNRDTGRYLRGGVSNGYLRVSLLPGPKTHSVHRLVCESFHGPAPEGKPLVLHRDDVRTNNRSDNLYWGDNRDNARDALANGRNPNANKTHCKRGHEYTPGNTAHIENASGTKSRICRECQRGHDSERRKKGLSGPDDPRHGTEAGYRRHRCKCERCVEVGRKMNNLRQNKRRAKRRAD